MKKLILIIAVLFSFEMMHSQNREIVGVTFPPAVKAKETSMYFNGCGLREKYTLDLYVAGLYLTNTSMDAKKIINDDEAQAIKIVIISSKVTRDKFNESVREGFENATAGKASKEQINKFKSYFADPFKVGDEILMIYKPGKGVAVIINDKMKGAMPGLEFKKALFAIWLGDKPASGKLKKGMLGQN